MSHVDNRSEQQLAAPAVRFNRAPRWRRRDSWWAAFFLAPQGLGILAFVLIPFVFSFILSFTDWNGFGPLNFTAFDSFKDQLTDPLLGRAILNTMVIALITVPVGLVLALVVAALLNRVQGKTIYTILFFAPVVTSSVAVALIWQQLLRSDGWISTMISKIFGIAPPDWLNQPVLALLAVCIVTIWSSMGLNVVIFHAGLQNVPESVLEAAKIDGASTVRSFTSIVMPLLSPTIFFQSVIAFIASLQTFDLVFVLVHNAGPDNATRTIVYHIYDLGIAKGQLGLSSAAAMILLVLSVIITGLQFGVEKRFVHYEN